jgi:3-isopropylmalate/(R)-2-methylmalate dehydratase large subunit
MILAIIGEIGTAGGNGHVIEFAGEAIRSLSMEGRMTMCNMSIEGGARAGLIAADETTFDTSRAAPSPRRPDIGTRPFLTGRPFSAMRDAQFDKEVSFNAEDIRPIVTWGTNPEARSCRSPEPSPPPPTSATRTRKPRSNGCWPTWDSQPGTKMTDIKIDKVFIGSCTNARIEDLRAAAKVVEGKKVAATVEAMVVPGSGLVKAQAEAEGLDRRSSSRRVSSGANPAAPCVWP